MKTEYFMNKKFVKEEGITFDDVLLVPSYSESRSRSEISTRHELINGIELDLPVISANMDSVTGIEMLEAMEKNGALGILYRHPGDNEIVNLMNSLERIKGTVNNLSFSVGVTKTVQSQFRNLAKYLSLNTDNNIILCIDVAHAHHALVKETAQIINENLDLYKLNKRTTLVIGNVATAEGAKFLVDECGALVVKIGIGGGSHCSTRIMTGCGVPQISAILEVAELKKECGDKFSIIADGGIKTSGDIAKALAAGADAVMLGRYLAGTTETPGVTLFDSSKEQSYKIYRGSASLDFKLSHGMASKNIEGVSSIVPFAGPVKNKLDEIRNGLRSAMSYCGVTSITELQEESRFIRVSQASVIEGTPHGISK